MEANILRRVDRSAIPMGVGGGGSQACQRQTKIAQIYFYG